MVKPITPSEVTKAKGESIPDEVLVAFNKIIAKKWNGREAKFTQNDVMTLVLDGLEARDDNKLSRAALRADVFNKGWLDVEDIYRAEGWKVEYDKPGYCETYEATFSFRK